MKYYTAKQAAKLLGLAHSSIRVYINAGKLKAKKIGRDWFISENQFKTFKTTAKRAKRKKHPA